VLEAKGLSEAIVVRRKGGDMEEKRGGRGSK